MSLYDDLKRKNVIRASIAYAVVSWVLIQVGDILFETLDLGPEPQKILLAILLLGFIPVVIFSWVYEITPEGIKRERDISRDHSITDVTAKRLDKATFGLLLVAIALFGADKLMQRDATTPDVIPAAKTETPADALIDSVPATAAVASDQSIAVLPFLNMSSDAEQEYFSDGITEEILNSLAKVKQLKVSGRTSSFSFRGKNEDLRTIGMALGVAHILEGSVRKAGNEVRITAQLIKVDDGFHLWSETYDGSLEKVFDLQEDISRQVTSALKLVMNISDDTRLASKMTSNIDAYDLFLRGREHVRRRIDNHLPTGIELLEQAVALDPQFAEAWAVLGEAEAVSDGYLQIDAAAALERGSAHVERAKAIDPTLVLPYAVSGLIKGDLIDGDLVSAISDLKYALELDPHNPLTLRWLSNYYQALGYFDKALPLYERAFELEPLSRVEAFNLATNYLHRGDLETSKQLFVTVNNLTGRLNNDTVAFILDAQGEPDAAKDYWLRLYNTGDRQAQFGVSAEEAEQYASAAFGGDASMKAAAQSSGKYFTSAATPLLWQLTGHLQIGNTDIVYTFLEDNPQLFQEAAADYIWMDLPSTKAFRQDPRFKTMLERAGIVKTWNKLGWPGICTPNAGTDGANGQFTCQ